MRSCYSQMCRPRTMRTYCANRDRANVPDASPYSPRPHRQPEIHPARVSDLFAGTQRGGSGPRPDRPQKGRPAGVTRLGGLHRAMVGCHKRAPNGRLWLDPAVRRAAVYVRFGSLAEVRDRARNVGFRRYSGRNRAKSGHYVPIICFRCFPSRRDGDFGSRRSMILARYR